MVQTNENESEIEHTIGGAVIKTESDVTVAENMPMGGRREPQTNEITC